MVCDVLWCVCAVLCSVCISHISAVESDLSRELQNGRLFRLLTQLNWITERPQSAIPHTHTALKHSLASSPRTCVPSTHCWPTVRCVVPRTSLLGDRQWCSTGDRYLLSLFRDCVFHSESADGRPVADLSFVVDQLNRLDVASSDKALLSSRDGEAMLIVRYADLKQAVQAAMHELLVAGHGHAQQQQAVGGAEVGGQQVLL